MSARCRPTILLLLVFSVLLPASLRGAGSAEFEEANRSYEQGKYSEAINRYSHVLQQRGASAALLYNLANACFKNGELGRAIFNYRRARALAPRDPDIAANLRFARDRVTGGASVAEEPWARVIGYFTPNELAVSAALLFWSLIALLAAQQIRPALKTLLKPYVSVLAVILGIAVLMLVLAWRSAREEMAIATHQQALRLGPIVESQAAFTVPDGTELRVENERAGWLQLSDRSGRTGWVQATEVLRLPLEEGRAGSNEPKVANGSLR